MTYVQWKTQQDRSVRPQKVFNRLILKKYYVQNQNENTDKITVRIQQQKGTQNTLFSLKVGRKNVHSKTKQKV